MTRSACGGSPSGAITAWGQRRPQCSPCCRRILAAEGAAVLAADVNTSCALLNPPCSDQDMLACWTELLQRMTLVACHHQQSNSLQRTFQCGFCISAWGTPGSANESTSATCWNGAIETAPLQQRNPPAAAQVQAGVQPSGHQGCRCHTAPHGMLPPRFRALQGCRCSC